MKIEQIKEMQRRIRPFYDRKDQDECDDGFWGPKSVQACQRHLRSLMPVINPWPKTDQGSLTAFYGKPGDESKLVLVKVPCTIKVKYLETEIRGPGCEDDVIYCHHKVADSLIRILTDIGKINPGILLKFAGCYNNRNMRNGSLPSLHARGAAVDLDPANNGNLVHWPSKATMPLEVMECFAREGWIPAGAFWLRDAMHAQATQ